MKVNGIYIKGIGEDDTLSPENEDLAVEIASQAPSFGIISIEVYEHHYTRCEILLSTISTHEKLKQYMAEHGWELAIDKEIIHPFFIKSMADHICSDNECKDALTKAKWRLNFILKKSGNTMTLDVQGTPIDVETPLLDTINGISMPMEKVLKH